MAKTKGTTNQFSPKNKKQLGRHKKSKNKHSSAKPYVGQGK